MPTKPLLSLGAVVLALACSESGEAPGDDRLFVPAGLQNSTTDVTGGWVTLIAFTLVQRPNGPELYAAVRNDGATPACNVGMVTDFYDRDGQQVASAGTGVLSRRFYRLDPDEVIFQCLDPGEIGMAASTNLPAELVIEDLGYLMHSLPGFVLDGIVPIAGLTVSDVAPVTRGAGHAYTGKLANGFDDPQSAHNATIFPVNRVGRPLGVATSTATTDIPPGGSTTFETSVVDDLGAGHLAYPAASN